ncbi:MAG TPA: D-alanine--D-alanine ligase [Flavobacterium sp.]|uniref:D-alanine--D-alanine ligase n=1 Tax=Flavobacterium sp. TaxID=239 RepID=UPI002BA33FE2|nr:D-alanine--D-alanine ligase [Flavobacterium sp.]HPW98753.1 D-alanine--D-alanine ligase [Flavobacterium sp.]HQA74910.1 D-alanine--D-alanine ligase [Flavobacterium sp.]
MNVKLFFHKLTHWEYWPFQIVYIPIYFLWAFYALRQRTIFFFNTCNPTMRNGGFIMDSKKEIYDLIPKKYYPTTEFVKENCPFDEVIAIKQNSNIQFPLIAKPDVGLRGSAVQKIESKEALKSYHQKANFDYIIQDLIPYKNEVGIFYIRFPNQKKGKITGIVAKEFLIVEGDGKSTVLDLILKNPRYEMQLKALMKEYGWGLNIILEKGEKRNLVPFGNHIRGAKFIDASDKISESLTKVIDEMCLQIDEFYFGRMDVMYNTWEELEQGINFQVVELNGAASEPTHIYDPMHSLFFAWKELARHITYMYRISVQNHQRGFPYLSHSEGIKQYRLHLTQSKKIVNF